MTTKQATGAAWTPVDQNGTPRAVPLTPPASPNWSQAEYVEASRLGLGFAAHAIRGSMRYWFHYGFPGDIGCVSVLLEGHRPIRYIDHTFERCPGWIGMASAACAKEEKA